MSVLGIIYFRFVGDLSKVYKKRFVLAFFVFFLGALGTEMLTGWFTDNFHTSWAVDTLLTTLEEGLEMTGVILMIHFLLYYIKDLYPQIGFLISNSRVNADQE